MLRNTFCHIPGIGVRTENRLWDVGVHSWDNVFDERLTVLPPSSLSSLAAFVRESQEELDGNNVAFFCERLPSSEQWRLFREFRHSVAYFDIETTGLRPELNAITTIALYDGKDVRCYVQGRNLDDFVDDIRRYKLLVTYNGKCFDVPFIEDYFGIHIEAAHIDLRFVLRSLGYGGGLKGCERQLGIDRGDLEGLDGYFAVLLWKEFECTRKETVLETLLAYNIEDVVNLERLMVMAYNFKLERTPFGMTHQFELPVLPQPPFNPDPAIIRRIRRRFHL